MKRDHTQAVEMYLQGTPIQEIMEEFSVSKWGLYLWLKKEGIKANRVEYIDKNKVRELRKEGMPMKKIADEVGCYIGHVSTLCKGVEIKRPGFIHCRKCGELKPFTKEFFNPLKSARFKLRYKCKDCYNEYMKSYQKNKNGEVSR